MLKLKLPSDKLAVPFLNVSIPWFKAVLPSFNDVNANFKFLTPCVIADKLLLEFNNVCVPVYNLFAPSFTEVPLFIIVCAPFSNFEFTDCMFLLPCFIFSPDVFNSEKAPLFNNILALLASSCISGS